MNISEHLQPQNGFAESQVSEKDRSDISEIPRYDFDNLREDLLAEENGERLEGLLKGNMATMLMVQSGKDVYESQGLHINFESLEEHIYDLVDSTSQPNQMIDGILKATLSMKIRDDLALGNSTGSRMYRGYFKGEDIYFDESYELRFPSDSSSGYVRYFSVLSEKLAEFLKRDYTYEEVEKVFASTSAPTSLDTINPAVEEIADDTNSVEGLEFVVPKFNIIKTAESKHPTELFGMFDMAVYVNYVPDPDNPKGKDIKKEHVLLSRGNLTGKRDVWARIQSKCLPGMMLRAADCDCDPQLEASLYMVSQNEQGLIILENDEGRGHDLTNKIRGRNNKHAGDDTFKAIERLGLEPDLRTYDVSAFILHDVGAESYRLITNNPDKVQAVEQAGIAVSGTIPVGIKPNDLTERHLRAKAEAGFSTLLADLPPGLRSRYRN